MPDDARSDAALVAAVGDVIRRPRVEPADSFVLHAPLELAARTALLPWVAPAARDEARQRLVELAASYSEAGDAVGDPAPRELTSLAAGADRLRDAIDAGDLDEVDATAAWLGRAASPSELRALLADALVPRLAAAAHAPIFLYLLPRVAPRGELTGELLRPLARELARAPEWRLTWHREVQRGSPPLAASELTAAIAATPRLGLPGSDFIFPIMSQVERAGVAAELLSDIVARVEPHAAARAILRAAAQSMLTEPPDFVPYGWSHCLTLPQAVLGIAGACTDPATPLAIAATFVVGFRAALAAEPLSDDAPVATTPVSVTELATFAATHQDAHLVKYTLACLDAAAWDPAASARYLAAAARLGNYWKERPQAGQST